MERSPWRTWATGVMVKLEWAGGRSGWDGERVGRTLTHGGQAASELALRRLRLAEAHEAHAMNTRALSETLPCAHDVDR